MLTVEWQESVLGIAPVREAEERSRFLSVGSCPAADNVEHLRRGFCGNGKESPVRAFVEHGESSARLWK